jgi:hypothetical protein
MEQCVRLLIFRTVGGIATAALSFWITLQFLEPSSRIDDLASSSRMDDKDPLCDQSGRTYLNPPYLLYSGVGYAYVAELPGAAGISDSNDAPIRSAAILCEDGKPLGPAHTSHDEIRRLGNGRFSHWGERVYFSASDNSDPNLNTRAYWVVLKR